MQIRNLKNYPQDGKHLEAYDIGIPVCITKGEDRYPDYRQLWILDVDDGKSFDFGDFLMDYCGTSKCSWRFKTPEKALEFAKKVYKLYLKAELTKLEYDECNRISHKPF